MLQVEVGIRHPATTPALYDRYMGPLLFEPYAKLIGGRCALLKPSRVLETAVGSGVLTRAVHAAIPEAELVATDLNSAMLEFAAHSLHSEHVSFLPADAQNLPFADGSFDLVLCQFGVMFFRDRIRANHEAHRVLRTNGHYLLSTFNRLELNPILEFAFMQAAAWRTRRELNRLSVAVNVSAHQFQNQFVVSCVELANSNGRQSPAYYARTHRKRVGRQSR